MSQHLSSAGNTSEEVRQSMSEAEQELEFLAIVLLGILGLLIARPLGALVQWVRGLRGR